MVHYVYIYTGYILSSPSTYVRRRVTFTGELVTVSTLETTKRLLITSISRQYPDTGESGETYDAEFVATDADLA